MYRTLLTTAALSLALSAAAFAQSKDQNASASGQWQASKFIHMNVYNNQNEKIGDIKELMLDRSGKIDTVVIGVGGFLGMGEHDVGVKFGQLKWVTEPVSNRTASNQAANNANARNNATTGSSNDLKNQNYPDHAVLNANKDQLKGMPEFKYNK